MIEADDLLIARLCICFASLIAIALIWRWARQEPLAQAPWRWGDRPRRARKGSLARMAVEHASGLAFFALCLAFAARELILR